MILMHIAMRIFHEWDRNWEKNLNWILFYGELFASVILSQKLVFWLKHRH